MIGPPAPVILDNMLLVVFVDGGAASLLPALAGGSIFLSPSILNPYEPTDDVHEGGSEFVAGMRRYRRQGDPASLTYLGRRMAFCERPSGLWTPAEPTASELELALRLRRRETREQARTEAARQKLPVLRVARIDPGEAECAALAITREWRFWSDDSGMVPLLRALYPQVLVERSGALVARAINEGLLSYVDGRHLYEDVFKTELNLYSRAVLRWDGRQAVCVVP